MVVVKSCEIEPEDRVYAHFKVESIKIETKENEEIAAEVLLGDDQGCLKLFLKGKTQVDAVAGSEHETLTLSNCLASVVNSFIRLEVDAEAACSKAKEEDKLPADLQVNIKNNLSLVEYELVDSDKDS